MKKIRIKVDRSLLVDIEQITGELFFVEKLPIYTAPDGTYVQAGTPAEVPTHVQKERLLFTLFEMKPNSSATWRREVGEQLACFLASSSGSQR